MMSRQQRHHCCCINVGNGKKRVSKVWELQRDGAPKVQAESDEDDVATEGLGPRWSQVLWRNFGGCAIAQIWVGSITGKEELWQTDTWIIRSSNVQPLQARILASSLIIHVYVLLLSVCQQSSVFSEVAESTEARPAGLSQAKLCHA